MVKNFLYIPLLILISTLLISCSDDTRMQMPSSVRKMHTKAPNFKLKSLSGKTVDLKSFQGKRPVFLVFWATWCGYCIEEIPQINQLRKKYNQEKLEIFGVNLAEPPHVVGPFVKRYGMEYEILFDRSGSVSNEYGVFGVPTMFLIDKEGKFVGKTHQISSNVVKAIDAAVDGVNIAPHQ